jgi:hypothetical protein
MNKSLKRLGAGVAVGALALAGVAISGLPAFATPTKVTTNSVFELLNSAGTPITTGSTTSTSIFGVHIDSICPAPYAADSVALFGLYRADHLGTTDGTFVGSPGASTAISDDGALGTNGLKATDTQVSLTAANGGGAPFISLESLNAAALDNSQTLTNGNYELRYTCYTTAGGLNSPTADDSPYFAQPITITGTTWSVSVPKGNTATSLSATLNTTTKVATFTAAVSKTDSTAGTPSGTVDVKNGATTLCSITLPATTCNSAALADGSYSAIATYNGDVAFNGSASSAYAFTVGAAGVVTGPVTVVIPAQGNAGLTLTGTISATINAVHSAGNRFTGSAGFGTLTVTDERQLGAPTWHLAGVLTTLTKGTDSIPATDLGWAPTLVGAAGAANAAVSPAVTPVHAGGTGFNASKPLASGDVPTNSATTTTGVTAQLNLDTEGNKPAGTYAGTLTVTLTAP